MITFAFVVLSLVLFGAALYFAFLYVAEKQESKLKGVVDAVNTAIDEQAKFTNKLDADIEAHDEQIESLKAQIQNLPKSDGSKPVPVPGPKDNFSKMEDRYAEQFKKTVVVDGIEQPTAEA